MRYEIDKEFCDLVQKCTDYAKNDDDEVAHEMEDKAHEMLVDRILDGSLSFADCQSWAKMLKGLKALEFSRWYA